MLHMQSSQTQQPLHDRLVLEAKRLKDEANALRPGAERDAMIRKARQTETASHINEWISSPGLRAPQ